MNVDERAAPLPPERPHRPPLVAKPRERASAETIAAQLVQQSQLIHALHQEVIALRAVQTAQGETIAKLDRYLRWLRWGRRVRGAIVGLFWLGVAAVIAYYWADISKIWTDFARFFL